MIKIKFNAAGWKAARQWAKVQKQAWPEVMEDVAGEVVEYGVNAQDAEIRNKGLVSTGKLVNSIGGETKHASDGVHGMVFNTAPHAPVMDQGRRKGARMPPPSALVRWVRRKKLVRGRRKKGEAQTKAQREMSMAFVIARSISRKGIVGRKYMELTQLRMENALPTIANRRIAEFARRAGK